MLLHRVVGSALLVALLLGAAAPATAFANLSSHCEGHDHADTPASAHHGHDMVSTPAGSQGSLDEAPEDCPHCPAQACALLTPCSTTHSDQASLSGKHPPLRAGVAGTAWPSPTAIGSPVRPITTPPPRLVV